MNLDSTWVIILLVLGPFLGAFGKDIYNRLFNKKYVTDKDLEKLEGQMVKTLESFKEEIAKEFITAVSCAACKQSRNDKFDHLEKKIGEHHDAICKEIGSLKDWLLGQAGGEGFKGLFNKKD